MSDKLDKIRRKQIQRTFETLLQEQLWDESKSSDENKVIFDQTKQNIYNNQTASDILNNLFNELVEKRNCIEAKFHEVSDHDIAKHGLSSINLSGYSIEQILYKFWEAANIMYHNDEGTCKKIDDMIITNPLIRMGANALWFCIMIWLFQSEEDVMMKSVQSVVSPTPVKKHQDSSEEKNYKKLQRQKWNVEDSKIFYFRWMQEYDMVLTGEDKTNRCIIEFRRLYDKYNRNESDSSDEFKDLHKLIKIILKSSKAKKVNISYEELSNICNAYNYSLNCAISEMRELQNNFNQSKDIKEQQLTAADYLVQWARLHALEACAPIGWILMLSDSLNSKGCKSNSAIESFASAYLGLEYVLANGDVPLTKRFFLPVFDFPYHNQPDPVLYTSDLAKDDVDNEQCSIAVHKYRERYLTKELVDYFYYQCNISEAFNKIGLVKMCEFCINQYSPWLYDECDNTNINIIKGMQYLDPGVLPFFQKICRSIKIVNIMQYVNDNKSSDN